MTKKTTAMWLCAVVGTSWVVVGLRDLFAPHLFRFDGQVAAGSTIILDFATAAAFLLCAICFRQAKVTG